MGEFDSLLDTAQFVRTIQELQGIRIASQSLNIFNGVVISIYLIRFLSVSIALKNPFVR